MNKLGLSLALGLFVLAACECGTPPGPPPPPAAACTVDEALRDARTSCVSDDDCPCGTGCVLGECVAGCTQDSECDEAERCDTFGRCRADDDVSRTADLAPVAEGRLVVSTKAVQLFDATSAKRVRVTARDLDLGITRVVADDGLEVSCDDGATFARECRVDTIERDARLQLQVRPTSAIAADESRIVRILSGSRRETVTFTGASTLLAPNPLAATLPVPIAVGGPLEGTYEGRAHLVATSISDDATVTGTPLVRRETVDLRAKVFTGGAIAFEDLTTVLAGTTSLVGEITASELTIPAVALHTSALSGGDPVELVASFAVSDFRTNETGARTINFDVVRRILGSLPDDRAVQSHFSVTLYRTGDIDAAEVAPIVPAPFVATLDRTRGDGGWIAAINTALTASITTPLHLGGPGDEVLETIAGRDINLVACAAEDRAADIKTSILQHALVDAADLRQPFNDTGTVALNEFDQADLPTLDTQTPFMTSPFVHLVARDLAQNSPAAEFNAFINLDLSSQGNTIPCAMSGGTIRYFLENDLNCPDLDSTAVIDEGTAFDVCEQMATDFGCRLRDVTRTFTPDGLTEVEDAVALCAYRTTFTVDVTRECVFDEGEPVVPRACGELALCYDGTPEARSSKLAATILDGTGDLECAASDYGVSLDVDRNTGGLIAPIMRNSCLADLERLDEDPGTLAADTMFAPRDCVDAPRLLYALNASLGRARVAREGDNASADIAEDQLAMRLMQRWVQLHGFIARESAQTERLAEAIRRDDVNDVGLPPALDDVLDSSLAGWDLFFHPRILSGIQGLSGQALVSPDYRTNLQPTVVVSDTRLGREQGDGPAVAMLEALSAQVELASIRVERAMRTGDLTALETSAKVQRSTTMVRPIARDMFERAAAHADANVVAHVWANRYLAAELRLVGEITRLRSLATALEIGANPLGIDDDDLPLYFLADSNDIGPGGKFSAISDFLLGTSIASPNNFAPFAVRQSQEALTDARTAWENFRDRQTARQQAGADLDARLEEINLRFAGELTSYCGTPGGLATVDVLEGWEGAQGEAFDAESCYIKKEDPTCAVNFEPWAELLTQDDILYQYCLTDQLTTSAGADVNVVNQEMFTVLQDFQACRADVQFPVACTVNGVSSENCFRCSGGAAQFIPTPENFTAFSDTISNQIVDAARATCAAEFPAANTRLPGLDEIELPALDNANCYRGSIGEAALTIRAVAQDVEIARAELSEFQDRYDIAINSCIIQQVGNARIEDATAKHNETMTAFRTGKLVADIIANQAGGVKDCTATASGVTPTPVQGGAAAASCAAGAVESAAESVSDGLQFAMDEAQQKHEAFLQEVQNDIVEQVCFNDAELELVGARAAALRIQRASADLQIAVFQMTELKILADTAYNDGLASIQAAKDRFVAPLDHDYFLDERLERYTRRFRIATRISYLAARAVEYEFQQSLNARGAILAAEVPDDLEVALDELWLTAGTRRINGNAPTDLKIVVSMKNALLQLGDNSTQPSGQQQLSSEDRFRALLQDQRFATFDDDGDYLGQQIPFELAPLEALGLGNADGISVFAANSCAERLFSVNATIVGDDDALFIGDDPAFVEIQLLKSNTFYSQWCSPDGQATPFQDASVRPSKNLFADPGAGALVGQELGLQNENLLFSRGRIEAFFNIDRDEFSRDEFENGDTAELAARGLYGKYALFFPAGILSTRSARTQSNGLDLNAIDDILLRLDYVSVAR